MLLTRSPLALHQYCYRMERVRLACIRHAASVRPEPGSNSPSRLLAAPVPRKAPKRVQKSESCHGSDSNHWQPRTVEQGQSDKDPSLCNQAAFTALLTYNPTAQTAIGLPALAFGSHYSVFKERPRHAPPRRRWCRVFEGLFRTPIRQIEPAGESPSAAGRTWAVCPAGKSRYQTRDASSTVSRRPAEAGRLLGAHPVSARHRSGSAPPTAADPPVRAEARISPSGLCGGRGSLAQTDRPHQPGRATGRLPHSQAAVAMRRYRTRMRPGGPVAGFPHLTSAIRASPWIDGSPHGWLTDLPALSPNCVPKDCTKWEPVRKFTRSLVPNCATRCRHHP